MTSRNSSIALALTTIIIEMVIVLLAGAQSVSPKNGERIVTDSQALINGISVDFSYNETQINTYWEGKLPSVQGCPKSDEGYPWVYYGSPKKCYLAGQQGPCEPDQSIFVSLGSPWGFCNCNCFEGRNVNVKREKNQDRFCTSLTNTSVYKNFVFKSSVGKCYAIYEQGPCKEDEWLVKTTESSSDVGTSQCEKRTCPPNQIPSVLSNTKCVQRIKARIGPARIIRNQCESFQMKYSKLRQKCVASFRFAFNL